MKKRAISIVLVVILVLSAVSALFTACGVKENADATEQRSEADLSDSGIVDGADVVGDIGSEQEQAEPNADDKKASLEEAAMEDIKQHSKDDESSFQLLDIDNTPDATLLEDAVMLFDNEIFTVYALGETISVEGWRGIDLRIMNKASDTYTFYVPTLYVDGIQTMNLFSVDVEAGSTVDTPMMISDTGVLEEDVKFTDIEAEVHIIRSEDIARKEELIEDMHYYPYGEDKAEKFVRQPKDTDGIILEEDDIDVRIVNHEINDTTLNMTLYVSNRTGKDIVVSADGVKIGNKKLDGFTSMNVDKDRCAFGVYRIYLFDMEAGGNIEDISDMEMNVSVWEYGTDSGSPLYEAEHKLKLEKQ